MGLPLNEEILSINKEELITLSKDILECINKEEYSHAVVAFDEHTTLTANLNIQRNYEEKQNLMLSVRNKIGKESVHIRTIAQTFNNEDEKMARQMMEVNKYAFREEER